MKKSKKSTSSPKKPTSVNFYYSYKKFLRFFIGSLIFLAMTIFFISTVVPNFLLICVMSTALCALYVLALFFGFISHRRLMVSITEKGINIDNYPMLKWEDVRYMKEEYISICGSKKGPLIFFYIDNICDYKLTHMQKVCLRNGFTAFTIPLYFLDKSQVPALKKELVKHALLK